MFAESMCFMLLGVRFSAFFGTWNTLWANLWCLWADLGVHRLLFEGLGLTLEVHRVTLGASELQFSSPWGHLGVILAAMARFWGLSDAQSRSKCTKNAKLLTLQKH